MDIMLEERPKDIKVVDGDLLIASTDKLSHKDHDQDEHDIEDAELVETPEANTATINNPDPRRTL